MIAIMTTIAADTPIMMYPPQQSCLSSPCDIIGKPSATQPEIGLSYHSSSALAARASGAHSASSSKSSLLAQAFSVMKR